MAWKQYCPYLIGLLLIFSTSSCRKSGCPATQQLAEYQADFESGKVKKYKTESGILRESKDVNSRKRRRKAAKRKLYK